MYYKKENIRLKYNTGNKITNKPMKIMIDILIFVKQLFYLSGVGKIV